MALSLSRISVLFQFTPLREGRRYVMVSQWLENISIHAPPRGATHKVFVLCTSSLFQFTPLREGRPVLNPFYSGCRSISIHAPPRGATVTWQAAFADKLHFNSRPSARGDKRVKGDGRANVYFNSRPSARGDWQSQRRTGFCHDFNSRPSARGDSFIKAKQEGTSSISIHAPPRGATRESSSQMSKFVYFNSRPSARGDSKRYAISANLLFNPYKSAWLNNNATQFVEIILVIFHRIIA